MSEAADLVRVEVSDGVAVLRLDRPKMNALNADIQLRIGEAAAQIDERSEVAAGVLTGGEQVFAAGADIKEMATMPYADMVRHSTALQDAFSKASDEDVKRVAAGWRVWKAIERDAKANVLYIHTLQPTHADVDYRPSLWLDRLLSGAPAELLAKYRDSFAVAPTMLSLTEFANMAVAPAVPANATPIKPGNVSPR